MAAAAAAAAGIGDCGRSPAVSAAVLHSLDRKAARPHRLLMYFFCAATSDGLHWHPLIVALANLCVRRHTGFSVAFERRGWAGAGTGRYADLAGRAAARAAANGRRAVPVR